ncbi:PDZ domain-containing protein [Nocardioides sp. GY 10127]|uniref:YlbL family protein n=1 Tax=Nocardioides sp. GY 10127 TaxID=2569762 RepID=UPI0010A75A9F|nr:PDZ domain-containing protein [Nocardioides sp. GY 10127]TIC84172.1 PDZ domain-containing protein [Nocardioides sp. GY 10127]
MTQRTLAAVLAVPVVVALLVVTMFVGLPYATYAPGPTINVLGTSGEAVGGSGDAEIITVDGAKAYHDDDGQLRMVTVSVSASDRKVSLPELLYAWFDPSQAVYPYDYVHPSTTSAEEEEQEGSVQMVTSQDVAVAVALKELGYTVPSALQVAYVEKGTPAAGKLKAHDVLLRIDGEKITGAKMLVKRIRATDEGDSVTLLVERDGVRKSVTVTPEENDGVQYVGFVPAVGYVFPVQVSIDIDSSIGGPSAGLMFSLGVYDTLTKESLTGGHTIAGTGTISADGTVGQIGGIQQKIAGAERDGAELFLVPADNCAEALEVDDGSPELVRVDDFASALKSVKEWVADPDRTDLPSCSDASAS